MRTVVFFKKGKDLPPKYLGRPLMTPQLQGQLLAAFEKGEELTLCVGPGHFTGWSSMLSVHEVEFVFIGSFTYVEIMQCTHRFKNLPFRLKRSDTVLVNDTDL